jgi:hypothetical protein
MIFFGSTAAIFFNRLICGQIIENSESPLHSQAPLRTAFSRLAEFSDRL